MILNLTLISISLLLTSGFAVHAMVESKFDDSRRVQTAPNKTRVCFKYLPLSSALKFTKQRESIEIRTFSASDGATVQATYFYYRSTEKALREMNRMLSSTKKIISREVLLDEKGQKSGIKVVGRFRTRMVSREFRVLWTEGPNFRVISGPSEEHVLQLLKPNCNF